MKTCGKCSRTNISDSDMYCPNCGSKELVDGMVSYASGMSNPKAIEPAPLGRRLGGALIDFIILYVLLCVAAGFGLGGAGTIPCLLAVGFILFRDASGGVSIGKRIAGVKVVKLSGEPASAMQSILRNFIFAIPSLAGLIPIPIIESGTQFLGMGIDTILIILECIILVIAKRRIGDRIAGTTVVVRA